MEKPVAVDGPGIRQVLAAAAEANRGNLKVGVGLNRRHSPLHEEAIPLLHDGVIGEMPLIRVFNCRSGVGKNYTRQPGDTELAYQMKNWFQGTLGSAELVAKHTGIIRVNGETEPRWRGRETENSYQIEHDRLFRAIVENRPYDEAERGAWATVTAIMGRRAAYTGKEITWEEALNSEERLVPDLESWDSAPPALPDADGFYPVAKPGFKTA